MGFSLNSSKSNIKTFFYLFCAVLTLFPFFLESNLSVASPKKMAGELYNPKLGRIKTLKDANNYVDSVISLNSKNTSDTSVIVGSISSFIKQRFYHGLSHYSYKDNWIAALSGRLFWDHFSAIVEPDDILNHDEGLCSQQAIVFMVLLGQKGIKTRSVGLGYKEGPGHFLTEVYYNGQWHLYDVNKEPKWEKIENHHKSLEYYVENKDTLYAVYETQMDRKNFNKIMEKVEYGKPNDFPAKKMKLFHATTKLFTYILPISFILLAFQTFYKNKKLGKKI